MSDSTQENLPALKKAKPAAKKTAAKKSTAKKAAKKATAKTTVAKTAPESSPVTKKTVTKKAATKKVAAKKVTRTTSDASTAKAAPAPKVPKAPKVTKVSADMNAQPQPSSDTQSNKAPRNREKQAPRNREEQPPQSDRTDRRQDDRRQDDRRPDDRRQDDRRQDDRRQDDRRQDDRRQDDRRQDDRRQDDRRSNNEQQRPRIGRVKGGGRVQQNDDTRGNRNNINNNNNSNRNSNNNRGRNRNKNRPRHNHDRGDRHERSDHEERNPVELIGPPVEVEGLLELASKGFGFLRVLSNGLEQSQNDVFVSPELIRIHGLRLGVWIHGVAKQGPRGLQITEITKVNDLAPEAARKLPHFDELKAVNPSKRIPFETTSERFTTRVLDIISPIGRGQRGLIVSPPRSGKTTMMLHMAEAVREKYEESMHLIVLLVDERPEEVTEFKRSLPGAEIYASSNDAGAKNHCRVAELCIERAKRLVEAGEHVFLLMDSITRLARSYNTTMGGNKETKGRGIQSGGIISGALEMPRRLFAAARNTRSAGSLTIVATALVNTNSRADEAIFQEFKGTGNMELVLDRRIAEQYIYPAVDIFKSGTRREELLLPEHMLHKIHLIRRGLAGHRPSEAMERLIFFLKRFHNNGQMLLEIKG